MAPIRRRVYTAGAYQENTESAREKKRRIKIMINPHVICRETEEAAWAQYHRILDQRVIRSPSIILWRHSWVAINHSWRGHSKDNWAVGGNVHLVGTPEQIVDWFIKLKRAGCDGMQVNFYDFLPDLDFFGKRDAANAASRFAARYGIIIQWSGSGR